MNSEVRNKYKYDNGSVSMINIQCEWQQHGMYIDECMNECIVLNEKHIQRMCKKQNASERPSHVQNVPQKHGIYRKPK